MSQTKRGNTYTRIVTLRGIDLTTATEVVVTVKPKGRAAWNFDREHISLTSDGTDTTIAYRLSQEQSLSIPEGVVYVDINWTIGGTRSGIPNFDSFRVTPTLYTALMDGTTDEPDPTYVDPDISVLPAEDVRVIGAVSPRVSFDRGEGCTVLTIHDIEGTHVVEIPDGERGPQGEQGIQGEKGDTGATGATGAQGPQGETGPQGPAGADGKDGKDGADGKDGQDGAPGQDGQNGTDGTDAYVYIRYSVAEPTSDSDMKTTPDAWIGIYSGDAASAPTHYTDYVWYKIKGETGAAGVVQDVQVNGVSVLDAQGVANVPLAENGVNGVVAIQGWGLTWRTEGTKKGIALNPASESYIKGGENVWAPIPPSRQHIATFFGLAKAAGADMKNVTSTTVGVYPEAQKSAIHDMLSSPVSVSGTTPTIAAKSGIQYVCGEVATLDITLPASGIVDVVFTSGSTPTVLTVTPPTGMTVEWANGFDSTALEADTLYELNIRMVGTKCLGVAAAWS